MPSRALYLFILRLYLPLCSADHPMRSLETKVYKDRRRHEMSMGTTCTCTTEHRALAPSAMSITFMTLLLYQCPVVGLQGGVNY